MFMRTTSAIAFAALLAAVPAMAQTETESTITPDPAVATDLAVPVDAAILEGYTQTDIGGVTAEELQGVDVYDPSGSKVASLHDVTFGTDRTVTGIVMDVGGFMGIGKHRVELTADQVELYRNADNDMRALVTLTQDELKALPEFEASSDTDTASETYESDMGTVAEPAPADPMAAPDVVEPVDPVDPGMAPAPMDPAISPTPDSLDHPAIEEPADGATTTE